MNVVTGKFIRNDGSEAERLNGDMETKRDDRWPNRSLSKVMGRFKPLKNIPMLLLLFVTTLESIYIVRTSWWDTPRGFPLSGPPNPAHEIKRQILLPTPFVSENETEASAAWSNIEAGHGLISVDLSQAALLDIPETLTHPRDPTKKVYVIQAYHEIHCIKYLRQHYLALKAGQPITWSLPHDMHCFDSLRQHVMCHADDTLLYTTGHRDAGHGQARQCRDWDALRQWATERTACYKDIPPKGWWGLCDGGDDGLPRDSLL